MTWGALSETFLTTWVQRDWFPEGLDYLFYGLIVTMTLLAVAGFGWQRRTSGDPAGGGSHASTPVPAPLTPLCRFDLMSCLALVVIVLLGQQAAFWFVDVEFNAGGRYVLVTFPAVAVLLTVGVSRLGEGPSRWILIVWLVSLLAMNIAAADNLASVLVPRHYPGWRMFELPG